MTGRRPSDTQVQGNGNQFAEIGSKCHNDVLHPAKLYLKCIPCWKWCFHFKFGFQLTLCIALSRMFNDMKFSATTSLSHCSKQDFYTKQTHFNDKSGHGFIHWLNSESMFMDDGYGSRSILGWIRKVQGENVSPTMCAVPCHAILKNLGWFE
jgi:hypothetical protein